jgi:hypothetical protein
MGKIPLSTGAFAMRRIFYFSLLAASTAMCLMLASCDVDHQSVPEPSTDTDLFCNAVAEPFCEALYACCPDFSIRVSLQGGQDSDDCKVRWRRRECLSNWSDLKANLSASLAAKSTIFDQAKLDACVARLKALTVGETACTEPPAIVLLNDCFSAFRGQIASGEPCTWGEDYPSNHSFMHCREGKCIQGACVPYLKAGDACIIDKAEYDPPGEICNLSKGEWCQGAEPTGICGSQGSTGDACTLQKAGYQCRSRNCDTTAGRCVPPGDWLACDTF